MGHARNYLTQDLIRRILRDYFAYDVNFVQNVTDVEDKIIIRAREGYLLAKYKQDHNTLELDIKTAMDAYFKSKLGSVLAPEDALQPGESTICALDRLVNKDTTNPTFYKSMRTKEEKFGLVLASLTTAKNSLTLIPKSPLSAIDSAKDILAWWLDKQQGHTVTDPAIFRQLAAHWEESFNRDMRRLHVIPPTTVTRVSEYVPEIVTFVEKIIGNGFAYEMEGDVWFDVAAFEGAKSKDTENEAAFEHVYAKLAPWSKGNRELLEDGEGSLTVTRTKRSPSDFALWKSSKPGEPTWPSPWGPGRPGWHIECSVMASEILGKQMDIHSGGVDLMFPHHDNEMAQAEACHDCEQWVNYFLHTGHLHIQGLKMSKSLKNFITVEEALKTYTPRQLRLAFMLQIWSNKMDLTDGTRTGMENVEETFNNFFRKVRAKVSEFESGDGLSDGNHHHDQLEKTLMDDLHKSQHAFRLALCDSFNTPQAISVLLDLISTTNIYLQQRTRPRNIEPVRNVAVWITRMVRMFGLAEGQVGGSVEGTIGWGEAVGAGAGAGGNDGGDAQSGGVDREQILMPYLRTLSVFRDEIRKMALGGASGKEFLELCDRLRDNELVDLGVALDDQEDGKALVKLAPAEELKRARDEKHQLALQKQQRRAATLALEAEKKAARLVKGKINPVDMFKPPHVEIGLYSAWGEDGVPMVDGEGVEVSKAKSKKFKKESEAQRKLWDEWRASQGE